MNEAATEFGTDVRRGVTRFWVYCPVEDCGVVVHCSEADLAAGSIHRCVSCKAPWKIAAPGAQERA